MTCAAGPNGLRWSVRPTSSAPNSFEITNYDDVVSPSLTGPYAVDETGLIVLNATTNDTAAPMSTAGVYTVEFADSANTISAKLVVIRK